MLFKSPDDELSEAVLWKVIGYAGFYISVYDVLSDDVTLTLVRGAKPVKLLKDFDEYLEKGATDGIYLIKGWKVDFPIQIIVTTELTGKEYAVFRSISKSPKVEDIQQVVEELESIKEANLINWYRDYMNLFSKMDGETLDEAIRRNSDMEKTLRDILHIDEEINTAVHTAVNEDRRNNLYIYVQDGGMSLDYAASRAGIPVDQFRTEMTGKGFRVPQTV